MSNKGTAYVLACAIYAGSRERTTNDDVDERIYTVLDKSAFRDDEVKADVYAQLAEKLKATTPFAEAVSIIEAALDQTQQSIGYL